MSGKGKLFRVYRVSEHRRRSDRHKWGVAAGGNTITDYHATKKEAEEMAAALGREWEQDGL